MLRCITDMWTVKGDVNYIEHSYNVVVMAYFVKFINLGAQRLTEKYRIVLFPATAQCLIFACFSHLL